MSSLAATITFGGSERPERAASVTDLVAGEACGLLEDDLVLGIAIKDIVQALVAVDWQEKHPTDPAGSRWFAPSGYILLDQVALGFATLDVVGTDVGENAFNRWHAAVHRHNRNAGFNSLLQGGRHGVHFVGADDDALHALRDGGFDVGGLLGRRHLAIAFNRLVALRGDLGLEGIHHVDYNMMTRLTRRTLFAGVAALSLVSGAGTALAADKILASVPGLSFPFFVHMMNAFKAEIAQAGL